MTANLATTDYATFGRIRPGVNLRSLASKLGYPMLAQQALMSLLHRRPY